MRPCYLTESIFHLISHPFRKFIYVANSEPPPQSVNSALLDTFCSPSLPHSSLPILAPSETLKIILILVAYIVNYIQVFTSVTVWWRALLGDCRLAAGVDRLHNCGTVGGSRRCQVWALASHLCQS